MTSASGDYAVCRGPEPCHYGGQWIIAAAGSDNIELAGSIMRTFTCDPQLMKKITEDIHEFTNTVSGRKEIAESGYKADVLGRQNPVPVYVEVDDGIRLGRALKREGKPGNHKYEEMCRRFLADEQDFSDEKLRAAGLIDDGGQYRNGFENVTLFDTIQSVRAFVLRCQEKT